MINREFIQNLTPVEAELLSGYIASLLKEKVTYDLDNHTNLGGNLKYCPKCVYIHFVKNGLIQIIDRSIDAKTVMQYFYLQAVLFFHAAD